VEECRRKRAGEHGQGQTLRVAGYHRRRLGLVAQLVEAEKIGQDERDQLAGSEGAFRQNRLRQAYLSSIALFETPSQTTTHPIPNQSFTGSLLSFSQERTEDEIVFCYGRLSAFLTALLDGLFLARAARLAFLNSDMHDCIVRYIGFPHIVCCY